MERKNCILWGNNYPLNSFNYRNIKSFLNTNKQNKMDNATHIQQGRSSAMENYVDFSGEKKSWLGYDKVSQLPSSDKNMYIGLAVGAIALQVGAGIYGVRLAHQRWGKAGFWWGALGFFTLSIPTGILLNELQKLTIQKKLENKLAGQPNLSGAQQAIADAKANNAKMLASQYGYSYGI